MPFSPILEHPRKPAITGLDHLVLTVQDLNETINFYSKALGMSVISYGNGRIALQFGNQKINLHVAGREDLPDASTPTPGRTHLCFVSTTDIHEWISHLKSHQVPIIEGPVEKTGAIGPITSVYIHDPDKNLIEIAKYN